MKKNIFLLFVFMAFLCSCGEKKKDESTALTASGNCAYSRDEKDPMGKRIKVVEEEKFIALQVSDSAAKELLKGEDFLKGYVSCTSVDTALGLYLDFIIHTDDAFQYYGLIKKDNKITFILKSGKAVELPFANTFSGNTNLSNESTEYSAFVNLPKSSAEKLKTEELHRVRISWTKKEEDYTVVNPKIFINQLSCVQ